MRKAKKWFIGIGFLITLGCVFVINSGSSRNASSKEPPSVVKDTIALADTLSAAPILHHQLDSSIRRLYKLGVFNGAILVAKNGEILYRNSFGWSDKDTKKDLSIDSKFQIASVSKQFTAVAILRLYQQGRIKLDQDLQELIPGFPYKGITVHHLLSHRSGLPNYMYFSYSYHENQDLPISNTDVVDMMINHKPDRYANPGRRHKYSNTGYALLAYLVEQITAQSFEKYMTDSIFTPLKMKNTFIYRHGNTIDIDVTKGCERGRVCGFDFLDGVVGDKGIYTTVNDLYLWDQALYSDDLLSDTLKSLAFEPKNKDLPLHRNYGYGWRTNTSKGNNNVFHAGWWHGYQSYFLRNLEDKTTVIILRNKVNLGLNSYQFILDILNEPSDKLPS